MQKNAVVFGVAKTGAGCAARAPGLHVVRNLKARVRRRDRRRGRRETAMGMFRLDGASSLAELGRVEEKSEGRRQEGKGALLRGLLMAAGITGGLRTHWVIVPLLHPSLSDLAGHQLRLPSGPLRARSLTSRLRPRSVTAATLHADEKGFFRSQAPAMIETKSLKRVMQSSGHFEQYDPGPAQAELLCHQKLTIGSIGPVRGSASIRTVP